MNKKHIHKIAIVAVGLVLTAAITVTLKGLFGRSQRTGGGGAMEELATIDRRMLQPEQRAAAARAIGQSGNKAGIVTLLAYLKDSEPAVRAACALALGQLGDRKVVTDLVLRMDNEDVASVRVAVAQALGMLGDPAAVKCLAARLSDESPEVRLAATQSLGQWTTDAALDALVRGAADEDAAVRSAANAHIARIGKPAIQRTQDVATVADETTRERLAQTLARARSPEAMHALVALMGAWSQKGGLAAGRSAPSVREALVDALASYGDAVVPALTKAAVNVAGQMTSKEIAGQVFQKLPSAAAVAAIRTRILDWTDIASQQELAIWTGVLAGMQTPAAKQASADIAEHVAKLKATGPSDVTTRTTRPAASRKPSGPGGFTGEFQVVLLQALPSGIDDEGNPTREGTNLILDLEAMDGVWSRVLPVALDYNNGVHHGYVTAGEVKPDKIHVTVAVILGEDTYVKGARAMYTITVARDPLSGRLLGEYTGNFQGIPLAGKAQGEMKPSRPVVAENFHPVAPGEHPRLLFRKSDLPALRQRFHTPLGQAYREAAFQSADLVSMAMLHQLTGDKSYATQAMEIVDKYKDAIEMPEDGGFGSGGYGHRLFKTCLALDMCWDAWPEDFRDYIIEKLMRIIPLHQRFIAIEHPNPAPCSNYYGPARAVPGIAAMLFWSDPGPEPQKPPRPDESGTPIEPPANFQPGKGVPVVALEKGKMPEQWLVAGPVPLRMHAEMLEGIIHDGAFAPEEGTKTAVSFFAGGQPQSALLHFQPLPAEAMSEAGVLLSKLGDAAKGDSTTMLFGAVKVERNELVALSRGSTDTSVWLAGKLLNPRQTYALNPGTYPMLVVHNTGKPTGTIQARLSAPGGQETALLNLQYDVDLAKWKFDHDAWERLGGADATKLLWTDVGYNQVYRHYRLGIGDGGFQAETGGYADIASGFPLVYSTIYYNVFGRYASGYPDVRYLVPRRTVQCYFPETGKPVAHKINSAAGFRTDFVAPAYSVMPGEYKAGLLWAWNKAKDVTGPATLSNLFAKADGREMAWTFLNYPLNIQPEHPGTSLPVTWESPTFGYYLFRSGWQGKDEFISQVFSKLALIKGWNHPNAGTFRIFGFGREWVVGSYDRVGFRLQEPCVQLPDDETNQGGMGRISHLQFERNGSGTITVNLDEVYAPKQERLWDRNIMRQSKRFVPGSIKGLRAFAFDYSGKSGAPALAVIVDKIDGGGMREWLWPLPEGGLAGTSISGNTFTLQQGDASMKLTFITPQDLKLEAGTDKVAVGIIGDRHHSFEGSLTRVKARAPSGHFFAVATFQRGGPPPVRIEGAGLTATITVGTQTIRFDGEKIILGK